MNRIVFIALIWLIAFNACQEEKPEKEAPKPYSWQLFEDSDVMFAPGLISTELPEFASTFSPDGAAFYFNRTSPDRSSMKIYDTKLWKFWQFRWR